jgi:hypothetical protein
MNREEITEMLASIGVSKYAVRPHSWKGNVDVFQKFAALVAAKEREECAKLCEFLAEETLAMKTPHMNNILQIVTDKLADAAKDCAEEIRARGQQ